MRHRGVDIRDLFLAFCKAMPRGKHEKLILVNIVDQAVPCQKLSLCPCLFIRFCSGAFLRFLLLDVRTAGVPKSTVRCTPRSSELRDAGWGGRRGGRSPCAVVGGTAAAETRRASAEQIGQSQTIHGTGIVTGIYFIPAYKWPPRG